MTARQIENRMNKLQSIEAQIRELEAEADSLKSEIKEDMESKALTECKTSHFVIRWKDIVSNRLDSKSLKTELPDIYARYCRATSSKRFSYSVA